MVGLLGRDHWSVAGQWEVNARIGNQVGLELSQVDIQGAVEPQTGCD